MKKSKAFRKGVIIMAGILGLLASLGLGGCAKDEEPIDGGNTTRIDNDAPKVIESKDISEFYAAPYLHHRFNAEEGHSFDFSIKPDDSGVLTAYEGELKISHPADRDLLDALQAVIDEHKLALKNGLYDVTAGLPYEFQPLYFEVKYESGETLSFTENNEPEADWEEAVYDVFADWFSRNGIQSLYPAPETTALTRLDIDLKRDGKLYMYGGINIPEDEAIDGQSYVLQRYIYDYDKQDSIVDELRSIPEDYYERAKAIMDEFKLIRNDDFGFYQPGPVYMDESRNEPDSKDRSLKLYAEFESGRRISIDTKKDSMIDKLLPVVEALMAYHESQF